MYDVTKLGSTWSEYVDSAWQDTANVTIVNRIESKNNIKLHPIDSDLKKVKAVEQFILF